MRCTIFTNMVQGSCGRRSITGAPVTYLSLKTVQRGACLCAPKPEALAPKNLAPAECAKTGHPTNAMSPCTGCDPKTGAVHAGAEARSANVAGKISQNSVNVRAEPGWACARRRDAWRRRTRIHANARGHRLPSRADQLPARSYESRSAHSTGEPVGFSVVMIGLTAWRARASARRSGVRRSRVHLCGRCRHGSSRAR